jgi:hypothetical protein
VKRSPLLLAALGGALLLGSPAAARAEIVFAESIEWVVVDSDWVGAGKVVKVEQVVGADKKKYEVATVAVSRTLKGKPADRVTFLLRNYRGMVGKDWMDEGIPLVFCLVKRDRARDPNLPAGFDWVLRDNGNEHCTVLLGKSERQWTHTVGAYTREYDVLTEPAAILKRVEKAAAIVPAHQPPRSHTVTVPGDTAVYKKLWSRSAVILTVPVDGELETRGRELCKSADFHERIDGAKILRHFKNEKNIQLLKTLLKDPDFSVATYGTIVPEVGPVELERKKIYTVRRLAYDALREFGAKVERPVLEEQLPVGNR